MGGPIPRESNISMVGVGLIGRTTSGAGKSSRLDAASVRSFCSVYSTNEVDTLLAGYQPLDSDLTAIAALTTTSFGRSLLTQADAATARTTLGAGTGTIGGTVGATDNRLVRSDGTGAATVQSTGITVDDSNNVSGVGTINATPKVEVIFSGTTPATPAYGSIALVGTTFSASPYIGGGLCSDRLQGLWFPDGVPVMGTRTTLAAGATFTTWLVFASTIGVGGQTSSFPGFNASGTTFRIRLADNSADAPLSAGAITSSALMCAGAYTVATLPSASANAGKFAQVTDSSVTTFGSTVSGGGSNRVPVFSNGTNWVVA